MVFTSYSIKYCQVKITSKVLKINYLKKSIFYPTVLV